ncbi:acyltransferase family protein [Flavobacterium sp. 28YEA47A]|uniref:acyltransferase family protein n=1 Tax=Flavobacterium sp. 28YEA47A TaxID=3156276 RepID=UPI00351464D3
MLKQQLHNPQRIFGLDLMRAVAILMVLSSHCLWIYPESNSFIAQLLKLFGFLGVEIFFVLSGFLIGRILLQSYLKEDFSFSHARNFLKRRWFRTFPNYFLILLINILIAAIIGYKIESLWKYFFFIQNFNKAMPAFFPESWSLSVEEWAYIVLPLFLVLAGLFIKPKNKSKFFAILLVFLAVFSLWAKFSCYKNTLNINMDVWNTSLKAVVIYRLDAIFYGVLASWFYCRRHNFWKKNKSVFLVMGILCFLFITFGIGKIGFTPEGQNRFLYIAYLPIVSISISFFLPFLSGWKSEKSKLKNPIVFISLISYSIYLLHYSVILQLMKYFIPIEDYPMLQKHVFTFAYLLLTIILSYGLYIGYEKPMMDLREKSKK